MNCVTRTDCRACGSKHLDLVLNMPDTPVGDDYRKADSPGSPQELFGMDVYLCGDCGLVQLLDVVSPELLYGHYLYATSISLGLNEHFVAYASDVVKRNQPAAGSLVIDVGSNDGTLLRAFKHLGFAVLGIEPAESLARQVTASGIETVQGLLERDLARSIATRHGKAAIVTANNVFANIDDLPASIGAVRELLDPRGVFVVETGYALDLVRSSIFDNIYHEHLSYFSVKPIERLFSRNGMELIDVQHLPSKGGSLRLTMQLAGGPRRPSPEVRRRIEEEESFGLYRKETFTSLQGRLDSTGLRLTALLKELTGKGKTIAGYGASVGSTTVMYYYGLDKFLTCLFDENPVKFDTLSPGQKIPVYSSTVIPARKPDYIFIVAWRYADSIIAKNKSFTAGGGQFITFLPELRTV
jgi:hypothetical protein